MICADPNCTGRHTVRDSTSERCPAATARIRAYKNRWRRQRYHNDPAYAEAERARIRAAFHASPDLRRRSNNSSRRSQARRRMRERGTTDPLTISAKEAEILTRGG